MYDHFIDSYASFISNVGLLSLLAWLMSVFWTKLEPARLSTSKRLSLLIGLTFGVTSALLMFQPFEFETGIFGDARGAPLLLSGMIGGPLAAGVSALIAGLTRFQLGGPGMAAGVLYVIIFALMGLAVHLAERQQPTPDPETWGSLLDEMVSPLLEGFFRRHQQVVKPPPLLSGNDLIEELGLQRGPHIGGMLERLLEEQAAGEISGGAAEDSKKAMSNPRPTISLQNSTCPSTRCLSAAATESGSV